MNIFEIIFKAAPDIQKAISDTKAAIDTLSLDELEAIPAPIKKALIDYGEFAKLFTGSATTAEINMIEAKLNGSVQ